MKRQTSGITRGWFGYRLKETDNYFKKLQLMQDQEAEPWEEQIREQRLLAEQKRSSLNAIQETAETSKSMEAIQEDEGDSAFLEQRLVQSIEAIRRQGYEEVVSLQKLLDRKRTGHHRQIIELDRQLAEYRTGLDYLMEEAAAWVGKMNEEPRFDRLNPAEEIRHALQSAAAALEPAAEMASAVSEEPSVLLEEDSARSAKIFQFKLKSILSSARPTESDSMAQPITADGSSAPAAAETGAASADRTIGNPLVKSSAFWGDLQLYLQETRTEQTTGQQPEVPAAAQESQQPQQPREQEKQPLTPAAAAAAPSPKAETGAPHAENPVESPALAEEIKSIQHRYMIGKQVGENLYGSSGQLIASKGALITEEMIEASNKAGKLPDLIVQMVIPGFGDEEE